VNSNKKQLTLLIVGGVAAAALPLASLGEDLVAIQLQQYQENDERIEVRDGKLSIDHDFGPNHTLSAEYDWDTISGASPAWDSLTGASATVSSDATTGATPCVDEDGVYYEYCRDTREISGIIGDGSLDLNDFAYRNVPLEDERNSLAFLYVYRTPTKRNELSLGASYSKEEDFKNAGVSAEFLIYTDRTKNRSVTSGISYMKNNAYDYLEEKWNNFDLVNAQVGITQVFDAETVAKFNIFYILEDGHLSNPYFNVVRRINVALEEGDTYFKYYLFRDSRPDKREGGGVSMQLAKSIADNSSFQLAYRYYQDRWDVQSHTVETKVYYRLNEKLRISPGLRYYTQSEASFFKAHDAETQGNVFSEHGFGTADHRLGDYDSWTPQLGFEYIASEKNTWNIVTGSQTQSSGLTFYWVNFGAQYKY